MKPGHDEQTVRRIEQAAGRLATQAVARMDDELPWFRTLPADQRSWVTLVAQAGIASFVEWMRSPDDVLRLTGEVFAAAPQAMARVVTLQQTVELVRTAIEVTEAQLPKLAVTPEAEAAVREELLRFTRELAFASARVYASAAESRGAWDARLEALVIDGLVRGVSIADEPQSQLAALGWRSSGPVTAMVGAAPADEPDEMLAAVHVAARRLGFDVLAGTHGGRLVVVLGNIDDPIIAANGILSAFGDGPVVVGPRASDVGAASLVTRAALSGLRAAAGWPSAPRPVSADALLPERALAGDTAARDGLLSRVYEPLIDAGDVLVTTLSSYFACGASLEATARGLFVHANTVRYRLRRIVETCGHDLTDGRDRYVIHVAVALGRLESSGTG
ncbi:MAG TPA: helix-turn-helix domain-containing protein [Jatrophihabitantaceae bacterium]